MFAFEGCDSEGHVCSSFQSLLCRITCTRIMTKESMNNITNVTIWAALLIVYRGHVGNGSCDGARRQFG